MAITKIHPIKNTLYLALDYIMDGDKTDQKILISSFGCNPKTAHLEFEQTKKECASNITVLARHLIQAFAPNETTPEQAHEIGLKLCQNILKDEYEYVIATHIDKGHIHNHIIFNNVNFKTGKAYISNKKTYHQIRYQSDKLCKENGLSVIDENYKIFKTKYKTNGKSYKEYMEFKKGNSWKNKLQIAIDRAVEKSKTFDDFIKIMEDFGYEIKFGKYLSVRHKDKRDNGRFTRAKSSTLGEDYTKEKIKERIDNKEKDNMKSFHYKKSYGKNFSNIIDMKNNKKVQSSKGYEIWANRHNMKTMASTLNEIRKYGINSYDELDKKLQEAAAQRQHTLRKIKQIEHSMKDIYSLIEYKNTLNKNKLVYDMYRKNKDDKNFYEEYNAEIIAYETALKAIKSSDYGNLDINTLSDKYTALKEEKGELMDKYATANSTIYDLQNLKKNTDKYIKNER